MLIAQHEYKQQANGSIDWRLISKLDKYADSKNSENENSSSSGNSGNNHNPDGSTQTPWADIDPEVEKILKRFTEIFSTTNDLLKFLITYTV